MPQVDPQIQRIARGDVITARFLNRMVDHVNSNREFYSEKGLFLDRGKSYTPQEILFYPGLGYQFRLPQSSVSYGGTDYDPIGQKDYVIGNPCVYNSSGAIVADTDVAVSIARRRSMRQTLFDGKSFDKNPASSLTQTLIYYYDTTRGIYEVSGPNERIVEDSESNPGRHIQVILPSYDNQNEEFAVISARIIVGGTGVTGFRGEDCIFEETEPRVWAMDNHRA